jgi:hypothetical protein
LLFSFALVSWCRNPARWKNVAGGICMGIVVLMSLAGVVAAVSGRG